MYNKHHPKAEIDRLYLKRKEGEIGLLQIRATYKSEIINTAEYLNKNYKEKFVNIVEGQERNHTHKNSTIKIAAAVVEE
jgi:hypothetical protein